MFFTKKLNTVFFRLIISYVILTTLLVLFIGTMSYYYYTNKFNQEMTKYNNALLNHVKTSVESNIIRRTVDLALSISTENYNNSDLHYFFTHTPREDYAKLYTANKYLKSLANTNSEFVRSIHVYYEHGEFLISSSAGLTYLTNTKVSYPSFNTHKKHKLTKKSMWTQSIDFTNTIDTNSHLITYIRYFPYKYKGQTYYGYVAIDLQEDAIKNAIKDLTNELSSRFIIMDQNNQLLLSINDFNKNATLLTDSALKIINDKELDNNNFLSYEHNQRSMISYTTIIGSGWKLISITSLNDFYKESANISEVLIIICILTIIIGLFLSTVISFRMYSPLKHIMGVIKNKLGYHDIADAKLKNEYAIINNTLNNISIKVSDLENTLKDSQPIIKHNLIHSLLNHTITNPKELNERLESINVQFRHPYFVTLIIDLNPLYMRHVSISNAQYIKYSLMSHIEGYSNKENTLLIAEDANNRIVIIINSLNKKNDLFLYSLLDGINNYTITNFELDTLTIIGTSQLSALDVHQSYKDALTYDDYKYFVVNKSFIFAKEFLGPYESETLFLTSLEKFDKSLRIGNLTNVLSILTEIITDLQQFNYSAKGSQQNLLLILRTIILYIKDMHIPKEQIMTSQIYEQFNHINNIIEFSDWVTDIISNAYNYNTQRSINKNRDIIDTVQHYIINHIGEDITLEALSSLVHITPRYLSKLFKEETDLKFSEFVTDCRLTEAAKQLESTDLKVEQVSANVGYYSTSHFIRKFKQRFGMTPNKYRNNPNKKPT